MAEAASKLPIQIPGFIQGGKRSRRRPRKSGKMKKRGRKSRKATKPRRKSKK